jgi:hypothetical protein
VWSHSESSVGCVELLPKKCPGNQEELFDMPNTWAGSWEMRKETGRSAGQFGWTVPLTPLRPAGQPDSSADQCHSHATATGLNSTEADTTRGSMVLLQHPALSQIRTLRQIRLSLLIPRYVGCNCMRHSRTPYPVYVRVIRLLRPEATLTLPYWFETHRDVAGSLFHYAVSITRPYSVDGRVIIEWWWIGKDLLGTGCGLILRYYLCIHWRDWGKQRKTSIGVAGRRGRESNPGAAEYEVGISTRPQGSVPRCRCIKNYHWK